MCDYTFVNYKYPFIHQNPFFVSLGFKKYTKIPANSQACGHVDKIKMRSKQHLMEVEVEKQYTDF